MFQVVGTFTVHVSPSLMATRFLLPKRLKKKQIFLPVLLVLLPVPHRRRRFFSKKKPILFLWPVKSSGIPIWRFRARLIPTPTVLFRTNMNVRRFDVSEAKKVVLLKA